MCQDKLFQNGSHGKSTPELDKLVALSEVFNVSLDELVKDANQQEEHIQNKRKIKINKKVLLLIWILICILIAFVLYRYLSIRKITKEYLNFAENIQSDNIKEKMKHIILKGILKEFIIIKLMKTMEH